MGSLSHRVIGGGACPPNDNLTVPSVVFGRVGRHVAACAAIAGRLVPVAWARLAVHRRAVFALAGE